MCTKGKCTQTRDGKPVPGGGNLSGILKNAPIGGTSSSNAGNKPVNETPGRNTEPVNERVGGNTSTGGRPPKLSSWMP
jgi:hypothetical protein